MWPAGRNLPTPELDTWVETPNPKSVADLHSNDATPKYLETHVFAVGKCGLWSFHSIFIYFGECQKVLGAGFYAQMHTTDIEDHSPLISSNPLTNSSFECKA